MVCILSDPASFRSKRALKQRLEEAPNTVIVRETTVFRSYNGPLAYHPTLLPDTTSGSVVVTTPKQTWLAAVSKQDGKLVVK